MEKERLKELGGAFSHTMRLLIHSHTGLLPSVDSYYQQRTLIHCASTNAQYLRTLVFILNIEVCRIPDKMVAVPGSMLAVTTGTRGLEDIPA